MILKKLALKPYGNPVEWNLAKANNSKFSFLKFWNDIVLITNPVFGNPILKAFNEQLISKFARRKSM